MFQYSVARHLSLINKCDLLIDTSFYGLNYKKACEISKFKIFGNIKSPYISSTLHYVTGKYLWEFSTKRLYVEKSHIFDDTVLTLPDSTILCGYYQSEKYFKSIDNIIRKDFNFDHIDIDDSTKSLIDDIILTNSVAVHVRRGDYIKEINVNKINRFHVCDKLYFNRCINYIRKRVDSPRFYFFSDDIKWYINNFRSHDYVFCDLIQSHSNSINDMRLISLCKNQIISNSSFSWWGAWLNNNENKIVLAPNKWLNAINVPNEDKLPDGWISISVN